MDEALLTGRFSIRPNLTRRSMSVQNFSETSTAARNAVAKEDRRHSARTRQQTDFFSPREGSSQFFKDETGSTTREELPDVLEQEVLTPTAEETESISTSSRQGSAARSRPISTGRSSSRADTVIRRSRSAFDVELFKSHLRLNKCLSRNRFKQEVLDLAHQQSVGSRATSAHVEQNDGLAPLGDVTGTQSKNMADRLRQDEPTEAAEQTQIKPFDEDITDGHNDDSYDDKEDNLKLTSRQNEFSNIANSANSLSRVSPSKLDLSPRSLVDGFQGNDSLPLASGQEFFRRARRRRAETVFNVVTSHKAGPRMDRVDGAIVIKPQRNKTRYEVSSEVIPPRRFTPLPLANLPPSESSDNLVWSCPPSPSSSTSEEEELMELMGHTPALPSTGEGRRRRGRRSGGKGGGSREGVSGAVTGDAERMFHVHETAEDSSDQYDTDCEVQEVSEFNMKEHHQSASCYDTDFGHLTYQKACTKFQVVTRRRIMKQLQTSSLKVNYCGMSELETKALALGLLNNSRLDELDLASNGIPGRGIAYMADCFQRNIYITKLNLSGNNVEEEGAMSLGEMLKTNTWLTHLALSECGITDTEIGYLAKGIQENSTVICLNLSKNKIEMHGGRHLGAALAHNNGIECLNLSWNMLRGGGAVAVCNSLQKNRTVRELNLAWNGLGFQGSLAISEALKVNRTITKLDISNNRVDWDCTPYLAKALTFNKTLQVLEIGCNPVSMDGCLKILEAIDRQSSRITFLSLTDVPINSKIAFKATEISKKRQFSMHHGGVISTDDAFGIQRLKREDPLTLLIRYLSTMGIRVVDLFRMFDTNSKLYVSQANFIRGLKRVRAPLDEEDMIRVARRMRSDKRGDISYQELAANVRSHIREERLEDRRLQRLENRKREERRRILQSDLPLYAPPSFSYLPALYNMYGSHVTDRTPSSLSPGASKLSRLDSLISRRGSEANVFRGKTPSALGYRPGRRDLETPSVVAASPFTRDLDTPSALPSFRGSALGRRSPLTLVRYGTKGLPGVRRQSLNILSGFEDSPLQPRYQEKGTNAKVRRASLGPNHKDPKDLLHYGLQRKSHKITNGDSRTTTTPNPTTTPTNNNSNDRDPKSKAPGQSARRSGQVPKKLPDISTTSRGMVTSKTTTRKPTKTTKTTTMDKTTPAGDSNGSVEEKVKDAPDANDREQRAGNKLANDANVDHHPF